jgi:hypothetical protein
LGARDKTRRLSAIVRRDGKSVRLFTRRGYDWTDRYPAIAGAAAKIGARSFTLDGKAVVCGEDGIAMFDALHRHGRVSAAAADCNDSPYRLRHRPLYEIGLEGARRLRQLLGNLAPRDGQVNSTPI